MRWHFFAEQRLCCRLLAPSSAAMLLSMVMAFISVTLPVAR
jgi:hypothetical protein